MTRYTAFWLALSVGLATAMVSWGRQSSSRRTGQLSERERRGRQVYLRGTSPSGRQISAVLGSGETEIPAATLACANCHGKSGLGTSEGGVSASNLNWDSLTRPYDVTTTGGRKHGPYDEATFKRAITQGLDPAGNRLHVAMPRFRISMDDTDALLAYVKKLGHILDPGVTDTTIRVATIVPPDGPIADVGLAVSAALQAYLDDLNNRGGIYGRRFELRTSSTVTREGIKTFIHDENIFAVLSPLIASYEKELLSLFEEEEIPLVGPFTYSPQSGFPINRHIFYLYAGLDDQARVLCQFAANSFKAATVGLVLPAQGLAADLAAPIRERCKALNLKLAVEISMGDSPVDAGRLAARLREASAGTVLFCGSAVQTVELATAAARIAWRPNLLLIGSLEGQELFDIPGAFEGKTFVAYPTLPSDWSADGLRVFAAMAERHHLSTRHRSSQISAISAADIFVEGLRRTGKDLSRARLVDQLEGLYGYNTGLTPAITFGPNRRVGALGAYVVLLNPTKKQFEPVGAWIPLD